MQVSAKRRAANQANAQKSTGPKSEEGKNKSKMNAVSHGLTAQTTIMTDEDRIRYNAFCASMLADLAPIGSMETFLAQSVCDEAWRLHQSRARCNNIVHIGDLEGAGERFDAQHPEIHNAVTAASVFRDHAKSFELLSLYEQRILRSFEKNWEHLRKLQAERNTLSEAELEKARLLYQLSILKGLPNNPTADGFVFSNHEIERYTDIANRLSQGNIQDFTYRERNGYIELPKLPRAA